MLNQNFSFKTGLTGITRKEAANVIAGHFGTKASYKGGLTFQFSIPDSEGREWKVYMDNSIEPERVQEGAIIPASTEYKVIVEVPFLGYENISIAQAVFEKLLVAGAFANGSCTAAVGLKAAEHNGTTLKNLVNLISSKQGLILKALGTTAEIGLNPEFVEDVNVRKVKTTENFMEVWQSHGCGTEKNMLDFHMTGEQGDIFFGFFNGTLDPARIEVYTQFCMAINAQALAQKSTTARKTETDNEKYTFRTWLLRMGLIGDEFKSLRKLLLENLEGNLAFKTPPQKEAAPVTEEAAGKTGEPTEKSGGDGEQA